MFQLSLVDHIRLSFGSVATSYRAHARAAERLTARTRQSRIFMVILLAAATGAALCTLTGTRPAQYAAISTAVLALVAYTIVLSLDFEPRATAHRACAARLWLISEKYRSLLAEVHDGLIDLPAVTKRRDDLMREVQVVYEHALPTDREAYRIAREALGSVDSVPSDQDIDRLLPASMRHQPASTTS